MPVLAVNSIPSAALGALPFFTITDILGLLMYVGGITFEATADKQKGQWMQEKKEKRHNEDFLTRGLWSKSRHPNYFGESTLWTGIATTAAGVMLSSAGQAGMGFSGSGAARLGALAMAGISPAFVTFLLLKVSGIPMSENKYDERYGNRKDYQEWKKNTPMFVPKLKHTMARRPNLFEREIMERNEDSAALREATFPRVYEYLKDAEIHYATHGPFDRNDTDMQIPLTSMPLDANRSLLPPPPYTAPYAISSPCFSLAVYGGDRACYAQLARQIYNYFLDKITEGNENPEGTRHRDSILFRLRVQNFIVMVYEPAKISDYKYYPLGDYTSLARPSQPKQGAEAVLAALQQKICIVLDIFLPSLNVIERHCIPHWCRMMPPLSGEYDPNERDEHGRVVDARMITVALLVPDQVHADWAGIQSAMDRVIQVEGWTGKIQCRILEDLEIRIL
ncbi:DUF1295-domain-containing protein [Hortaea werneckii]|nr:DUF1295-domain-containing protein [Hortaea werneckii]